MSSNFKRLLSLVKKTGDTLVIQDEQSGGGYVLLSLDKYEELLKGYTKRDFSQLPSTESDLIEESILDEKKQAEVIPGITTEVVEISEKRDESELNQEEKYYFEEIDEAEGEEKEEEENIKKS